jgi:hypothetical protein
MNLQSVILSPNILKFVQILFYWKQFYENSQSALHTQDTREEQKVLIINIFWSVECHAIFLLSSALHKATNGFSQLLVYTSTCESFVQLRPVRKKLYTF